MADAAAPPAKRPKTEPLNQEQDIVIVSTTTPPPPLLPDLNAVINDTHAAYVQTVRDFEAHCAALAPLKQAAQAAADKAAAAQNSTTKFGAAVTSLLDRFRSTYPQDPAYARVEQCTQQLAGALQQCSAISQWVDEANRARTSYGNALALVQGSREYVDAQMRAHTVYVVYLLLLLLRFVWAYTPTMTTASALQVTKGCWQALVAERDGARRVQIYKQYVACYDKAGDLPKHAANITPMPIDAAVHNAWNEVLVVLKQKDS
jgi:hypothetical protein